MNEYKHGDWYCKPANEAEAIEIVERAVANGAELFESVGDGENKYPWNFSRRWGVRNNYTFAGTMDKVWESDVAKEYTIEQVREKFPLPSELEKPVQRDGVGLPPVGTICDLIGCGITVEIIAHAENNTGMVAVFKYYDYNGVLTVDFKPASWFHPIKTEREQWALEAQKHCTEFGSNQLGKLYDAIKSGDLKAPEVNK